MLASVARHLGEPAAAAAPTATTESVEVTDDAGFALSISGPTPTLTPEEERAYALDGLVVPQAQLSPGATAALQDLVERTLAVTCAADPPVEMPVAPHCPTNLYGGHGDPIPEDVASMWMALARQVILIVELSEQRRRQYEISWPEEAFVDAMCTYKDKIVEACGIVTSLFGSSALVVNDVAASVQVR